MVINRAKVVLEKTDAVCTHAPSTLLHCVVTLHEGADPVNLGPTTLEIKECAYIWFVDPRETYTDDRTVIFRCRMVERERFSE